MEGILEKVLKFLFVPESSLSWIFLGIFILVIAISVYYDRLCRKKVSNITDEIKEKYRINSNKYSAKEFLDLEIRKNSANEGMMEDVPNLFVSIGILGTFIGLGIAIQGAAELLSTDKVDIARLNDVLGIIAFKFQTSVWGTCFSILYQKLFLERYFVWKDKLVEETYEELVHLEKETANTLLQQQLEQVTLMQASMSEFVSFGKEFMMTAAEFKNDVVKLDETIIDFKNSLIEHMEENTQSLKNHQQNIGEMQQQMLKALDENLVATRSAFIEEQENVAEKHDGMLVKIHRSVDTLQKVFLRSENQYVQETQNALSKMLADNIDKVNYAYLDKARRFSDVVDKFDNILSGMNQQVDSMHNEFVEEHKKLVAINNKSYREVQGTMAEVKEIEAIHQNNVASLCKNLEKLGIGYKEVSNKNLLAIQETANKQAADINAFKITLQDNLLNKFAVALASAQQTLEEQGNTSHNALVAIKSILEKNKTEATSENVAMQKSLEALHSTLKEAKSEQANSLQDVTKAITDIFAVHAATSGNFLVAIKETLEKNNTEGIAQFNQFSTGLEKLENLLRGGYASQVLSEEKLLDEIKQMKEVLLVQGSTSNKAMDEVSVSLGKIDKELVNNTSGNQDSLEKLYLALEKSLQSQGINQNAIQIGLDNLSKALNEVNSQNQAALEEIATSYSQREHNLEQELTELMTMLKEILSVKEKNNTEILSRLDLLIKNIKQNNRETIENTVPFKEPFTDGWR